MVQIEKRGKTVTALCSRCKESMSFGGMQFGKLSLKCNQCGWVMIPNKIVDQEVKE